jgi:hypothetical protein
MVTLQPIRATDSVIEKTLNGFNMSLQGDIFQMYGAATAIATSTTETSLLNITATGQAQGFSGNPYLGLTTLPVIPANSLALGTLIRGKVVGTIANTSTPNAQVRVVLKNSAGAVVYALADSTAVAMTNVSTSDFEVNFDCMVKTLGTSGSIYSRVNYRYATTTVYTAGAAVTVDTTAQYYLDVMFTWGTSSSSNTVTAQWAVIGVE